MAYPIVSRVNALADSFGTQRPKEGYIATLEKIMLEMKITDMQMERVFFVALDEKKFPSVGEMRRLMERFSANAKDQRSKQTHVLTRCPGCGYGYAIPIERISNFDTFDELPCEGLMRIAPNKMPARNANFEYEKCNQVYSLKSLAEWWYAQGHGQSFTIPQAQ